jgi:hypothetical protein
VLVWCRDHARDLGGSDDEIAKANLGQDYRRAVVLELIENVEAGYRI